MPIHNTSILGTESNTPEGEQKTTAYSQVDNRGAAQLSTWGKQREEAELEEVKLLPVPTDSLPNTAEGFKERMVPQRCLELGEEGWP